MHHTQTDLAYVQGHRAAACQRVCFYNLCKDTLCPTAALPMEAYEVLLNKNPGILLTPISLVGKGERKNIIDSFLLFVTPAKPFFSTLHFEIERLCKNGNKAKANTRSREEKALVPFPFVEEKVSLSLGSKKGQICRSITSNLCHQLHPAKSGAAWHQVPPATSSTDLKRPLLNSCSNRSLEVEPG